MRPEPEVKNGMPTTTKSERLDDLSQELYSIQCRLETIGSLAEHPDLVAPSEVSTASWDTLHYRLRRIIEVATTARYKIATQG